MKNLGRLWAGRIFGTNTGNLFAEFDVRGDSLTGTVRVMDPMFGLAIYAVSGSVGDVIKFSGSPTQVPEGADEGYGEIMAKATLSQDGALRGEWTSSVGTAGTFELHPHRGAGSASADEVETSALPQQLVTRNVELGAIRLHRDDVEKLISRMQADFSQGRPVATFTEDGNEYTKYFEDFKSQVHTKPLTYLKVQIQNPRRTDSTRSRLLNSVRHQRMRCEFRE